MMHALGFGFLVAFLFFIISLALYYEVNKHNLLSSVKDSLISIETKFDTAIKLASVTVYHNPTPPPPVDPSVSASNTPPVA